RPPASSEPAAGHASVAPSRRGAGDAFDLDPAVVEQLIEHAPGERAMRTAALQRQIDRLGAALARSPRRLPTPARRARRERVGNEICKQNGKHSRMSAPGALREGDSSDVGTRLLHCNINYGSAARAKNVQNG